LNRIKSSIHDFPKATIIERNNEEWKGPWLETLSASRRYGGSSPRVVWGQIRAILESNKIPVDAANIQGQLGQNWIEVNYDGAARSVDNSVPVLIATTYHPNWQRPDSEAVYAATPMFMMTFVRQPTRLMFARKQVEKTGVWVSAFTLAAMVGFAGWNGARQLWPRRRSFGRVKQEERRE
jgi:hypothetical protein